MVVDVSSPVNKFNETVIEFSLTALKVLSQTQYYLITSDTPVSDEKEEVSVFQYNKESLTLQREKSTK